MSDRLVSTVVLCLSLISANAEGQQAPAKPVRIQPTTQPQFSKEQVAADLQKLDVAIAEATKDTAAYAGGLVKSLIDLRLATLKQSHAMLSQRVAAQAAGISIRYTVEGRLFSLPPTAREELSAIEGEMATLRTRIDAQQAEADRYSGGLVQAMSLSTVATSRQTLAMLDQKRLALQYGLPQFVGFAGQIATTQSAPAIAAPAQAASKHWEIVEVDSKITETNSTWSRFAWKLTMKNSGSVPLMLDATIEFQDKDGFVVDSDSANRFSLSAGATDTVTGFALINAEIAGNVARTVAKVRQISR